MSNEPTPTHMDSLEALFAAFPAQSREDPTTTARAYLMALEGIEPRYVAEAVRRYIQGRVDRERHTFAPSTAELAREARDRRAKAMAAAPKREQTALEAPVNPAIKARVAALMAGLAAEIGGRSNRDGLA